MPDGTKRAFTSTALLLAANTRITFVEQPVAIKEPGHSVADVMRTKAGIAAINGGYFTNEFTPAGLLRIDERTVSPKSDEAVLSGFIAIDATGKLTLRTRDDKLDDVTSARQSGPFIIDPGGNVGIKWGDKPAFARRSMIAATIDGYLALIATTDVSLFDLATCLHEHPDGFGLAHVERALNLDGGPSTALCMLGRNEPIVFSEKAPVRDVVVVLATGK
ncbi:MAG: phosphodiester glycosidase family protein [Planctomycetes bacterium]|nr:phosphodiester glycosidase family protein [Planctomycetota bacterium]